MKYSAHNCLIYLIGFLILLLFTGGAKAAYLIRSDGAAIITSQIDVNEYRKLAIEDALQNISSSQNIELNSFSLIENGKVLIDQIQSTSSVEILNFEVIQEKIKSGIFYVTIEALIQDRRNTTNDFELNSECRQTKFKELDLISKIRLDRQKFPVWFDLDEKWLREKISEIRSLNGIKIKLPQNEGSKNNELYTLFKNNEPKNNNPSLYKIELNVSFEKKVNRTLISKKSIMSMKLDTRAIRDGKVLTSQNNEFEFNIYNSLADLSRMSSKRQNWQFEKEIVVEKIQSELKRNINELRCISIEPKIFVIDGNYSLEFGSLDGLTQNDIFEVTSKTGGKVFLKVAKIGLHETTLEPISQRSNLDLLQGKKVKILSR